MADLFGLNSHSLQNYGSTKSTLKYCQTRTLAAATCSPFDDIVKQSTLYFSWLLLYVIIQVCLSWTALLIELRKYGHFD